MILGVTFFIESFANTPIQAGRCDRSFQALASLNEQWRAQLLRHGPTGKESADDSERILPRLRVFCKTSDCFDPTDGRCTHAARQL